MQRPELFGTDSGAFLNLSAIYYLMVRNKSPAMIDEAQARMWDLALHMEEGATEESARSLEAARQAVRDAEEKLRQNPSDANREALEQRLKELREAIDRHMRAMMEEAERNHEALPFDPDAEHLSNQDLDRLAEEAQKALREGRLDEAREKMAELEQLLDRLKQARADKGQGNSQQRQKARRQMGAVQDMVGREGGLLDHAVGRDDQANRPPQFPAEPKDAEADTQRPMDQRVQQALRSALGEMMQQFGDLTGEVPPSLGEADLAMRGSAADLGAGDDKGAAEQEQKAIEALQKGAREMGRTLQKQFGRGRGEGSGEGEGDGFGAEGPMGMMMPDNRGEGSGGPPPHMQPGRADNRGRDPLGRTNQGNGLDTGDVRVPEEAERQRSQAIQEELRRRGAERERPQRELDYIDRLLKQF
jgi:tetratricopeptide (TPR) repeat protein